MWNTLRIHRSASHDLPTPFPVGQVALTSAAVVLSSKRVFYLTKSSTHVTVTHECGAVINNGWARAFIVLHTLVNCWAIPIECMRWTEVMSEGCRDWIIIRDKSARRKLRRAIKYQEKRPRYSPYFVHYYHRVPSHSCSHARETSFDTRGHTKPITLVANHPNVGDSTTQRFA